MLTAFELFDYLNDGYISRVDFRKVLQEFGFNVSITDLDHFLSRYVIITVQTKLYEHQHVMGMVSYVSEEF